MRKTDGTEPDNVEEMGDFPWQPPKVSASISNDLLVDSGDLTELLMYADTAAKILRENGYPGKAEALEKRYMKIAKAIGFGN